MKKTILIIDNDTKSSSLISKTLEPEGLLVFAAASGDAAVTMAKKVSPLLVFLNLATPGTGLEICKALHSLESIKDVPLVLLTVRDSKFDPRYKTLYGIVGFLKKPLNPDDILSITNSLLVPAEGPAEAAVEINDDFSEFPQMPGPEMFPEPASEEAVEETFEDFQFKDQPAFPEPEKEEPFSIPAPEFEEPVSAEPAMPIEEAPVFLAAQPAPEAGKKGKAKPAPPTPPSPLDESLDEFFARPEEKSLAQPALSQKKRLRVQTKKRGFLVPGLIIIAVAIIAAAAAYMFLKPKPVPRTPAEVTAAKDMSSKPLKKPQSGLIAEKAPEPAKKETPSPQPPKGAPVQPKPVAQPTPVAQPKIETQPPKGGYYVQFGVFSSKENAENLIKDLKTKGEDASVSKGASGGGKDIYRVLSIAAFDNKKSALNQMENLKNTKKIQASVFYTAPAVIKQPEARPAPIAQPPKPVIEAVPTAQPKTKPLPSKKAYYVQFGVFSSKANAENLVRDLKAGKGQEASVHEGQAGDKQVFRVLSTQLSKKDALNQIEELKTKNIQAALYQGQ